jgi:NitT/TauT family transport system substrate-binding protein
MNRRAVLLVSALSVTLSKAARAQTAPALKVIGPPNDGFKAVYYGARAGIFRKYGVNVEPTLINSGNAAAAALIGATADVAFTNVTTLLVARAKTIPIQVLAPGAIFQSEARPGSGLIALKDGPIRSGRDLNGKIVGSVSLGDTMAATIQAWVDQNGGDAKQVRIVEVPASAVLQTLEEGRVLAAGVNEPALTQALATNKVRLLANLNAAIAKSFLQAMFAVMGPAADRNVDAMRRFAGAMHESAAYTNTHPAETVELVASYSGIAPDVVARSARLVDAEYADVALIQPVIDVLVKYGVLPGAVSAADVISPYALKRR